MSFLLITNVHEYIFVKELEAFKNHLVVEVYSDKSKKKIKPNQIIVKIDSDNQEEFNQKVDELKQDIDITTFAELIEDCDKFISIFELTKIYFSDNYTNIQLIALLFALYEQNLLFSHDGYGNFSKDSQNVTETKLKNIEEQKQYQEKYNNIYQAFINLEKPDLGDIDIIKIINKSDKNSIIFSALHNASKTLKLDIVDLCYKVGLIDDLADFFLKSFIRESFPSGIRYNTIESHIFDNLKIEDNSSTVYTFSIDDENTSEIDDAFSVKPFNDEGYLIGVHISAPAINSSLEEMVSNNISTIYYPNGKITMLPQDIIKTYSLDEKRVVTVVSIYFVIDKSFEIKDYYSKLEKVSVAKNLRIEELELLMGEDNDSQEFLYKHELDILYNFALALEQKRGKPSVNSISVDYSFKIDANCHITIKPRYRGNKIDKTVSELMILANCSWGRLLTNHFIPAIYRVKQPNTPVVMTLNADSHTGLNVSYYTWATSPLRRASDYVNQRQIIAMLLQSKHHYDATNHILLNVVDNFDKTYNQYINFQNKMERYWSLKYLLQENITEIDAIFVYKSKVQLIGVPIELDVQGLIKQKEKGTKIRLRLFDINLATLNFNYKILEHQYQAL
jgi:exoribonuclease-2